MCGMNVLRFGQADVDGALLVLSLAPRRIANDGPDGLAKVG